MCFGTSNFDVEGRFWLMLDAILAKSKNKLNKHKIRQDKNVSSKIIEFWLSKLKSALIVDYTTRIAIYDAYIWLLFFKLNKNI